MALTFVTRNGQRLTPWMLYQINRLDADMYRLFKVHIIVSSGIRLNSEQVKIFLSRYVTAANIRGRKVYDTRVWNNVRYYRVSSAGTVAVPGTSNHEVQGTKGAVDIHDTGTDSGVTVKGSVRGQWIRRNCRNYSMIASGDGFGEGWHFDMINIANKIPSSGGGSGMTQSQIQSFLVSLGYDTGGIGNGWGDKSEAATKAFQKLVGLTVDGIAGPDTQAVMKIIMGGGNYTNRKVSEIQTKLNSLGYNAGKVDNAWGNHTSLGTYRLQRAKKLKADAQWGTATDAAAFPIVVPPKPPVKPPVTPPVVETVPGRNATSRPTKDIQAFLKIPQTGLWDKATATATRAFQASKLITEDYIWGKVCDGLAFPPKNFGFGIDYSFARPSVQVLSSRGVKFAARYLYVLTQADGSISKGLSKAEYDALTAVGIAVPFIYEETGKELQGGKAAGIKVATSAENYRNKNFLPKKPIYFNVDYDAPPSDYPAIFDALRGIASIIGLDRTGLYGGYDIIKAAFDAGLITWGMQTAAWSEGKWDARAQLRQWANGQWGGSVDFQWAMTEEYGQSEIIDPPVIVAPQVPEDIIQVTREHLETVRENIKLVLSQVESLLD